MYWVNVDLIVTIVLGGNADLRSTVQPSQNDRLLNGQNYRRSDTRFSKAGIGPVLAKGRFVRTVAVWPV